MRLPMEARCSHVQTRVTVQLGHGIVHRVIQWRLATEGGSSRKKVNPQCNTLFPVTWASDCALLSVGVISLIGCSR